MKEVENIFFITGLILILYVLGTAVLYPFSSLVMTTNEFVAYIAIATVGFSCLIVSAYANAERKRKEL